MAIVELNRKVEFIPDMVSPICVPLTEMFDDRPKEAYVAGWGYDQYHCDTNDNGPNPHTQCKFPFIYNGEVQRKCAKTSTPAAENPICKELFNWAKYLEQDS